MTMRYRYYEYLRRENPARSEEAEPMGDVSPAVGTVGKISKLTLRSLGNVGNRLLRLALKIERSR
jgi:hypothetical protein